jgi:hypothetical protein
VGIWQVLVLQVLVLQVLVLVLVLLVLVLQVLQVLVLLVLLLVVTVAVMAIRGQPHKFPPLLLRMVQPGRHVTSIVCYRSHSSSCSNWKGSMTS